MIYELRFLESFHDALSCAFMDWLMVLVSWLGNGGAIWTLLCLVLLCRPQTRRLGLSMVFSLLIELVFCTMLKNIFARPRPFSFQRDAVLLIPAPTDWSFPSGHTASSFAAVSALHDAGWKAIVPASIIAALITISRMYLFVHYPSDIIAGLILGLICGRLGRLCVTITERFCKKRKGKEDSSPPDLLEL